MALRLPGLASYYVMDTVEAPPRHTGTMHTLDRTGDTRVMWDKDNEDEVAAARKTFRDLKAKGYLAYKATGKRGDRGEQIREFDPDLERIILVQALQGG